MKYKKTTLPNGLRIITVPTKANPAVTVMVIVEAGSNYETKEQNGLSHFLEHMMFKGTAKRPSSIHISRELDSLGAESNAFTGNELTGYWAKSEKKHFKKLVDILSDMYMNPILPAEDLEKERGVILQEISMYEDLPQAKVQDVLAELMYGDTPAGRPIIGPAENIKRFSRQDFVDYRDAHYVAGKTMVVVSGDVNEKDVKKEVEKAFKDIKEGKKILKPKVSSKQKAPASLVHSKKTDQMHMIMSFRGYHASDKRVPALAVLSAVLGQGMSSRLFQKLRDDMGVCYYVKARSEEFANYGQLVISTGIDAKRNEEVVKVLIDECRQLKDKDVPDEELKKAKEYLVGRLYLGLETSDALAGFYAEQEITVGTLKTPSEIEKEIRGVTAKDIQKVARDLFKNDKLNLAVVGNMKDSSKIEKILTF